MVRLVHVTIAAIAACACIAVLQVADQHKYTRVLMQKQNARYQQLGEDRDWDMHHWSKKHTRNVEGGAVDKTSVHNIWHSKKQAWAGIDDILPTGGQYGYEINHYMPANGAKMLDFIKHTKHEVARIEARLPPQVPKGEAKEEADVKDVLDGDMKGIASIKDDLMGESAHHAARARPIMLAAQSKGRVYVDDALYGEGIVGDVKSQGHKKNQWSRKNADADMDTYYASLAAHVHDTAHYQRQQSLRASNGKPAIGSNEDFDNYFNQLDEKAAMKHAMHEHILKQDGYFNIHPMEHKHLHEWIESQKQPKPIK